MVFKKGYTSWNKGKRLSEEHKKHLREAHNPNYFGHSGPRPNISKAKLEWYKTHDHPLLGKKQTQQTKDKIAKVRLEKKLGPFSEEHRRKISESLSEETKKKISIAHINGNKLHPKPNKVKDEEPQYPQYRKETQSGRKKSYGFIADETN